MKAFLLAFGMTMAVIACVAIGSYRFLFTPAPETQRPTEPGLEFVNVPKDPASEPEHEPISTTLDDIPEMKAEDSAQPGAPAEEPKEAKRPLAAATNVFGDLMSAQQGDKYAMLYAPDVDIEAPLYYGDSSDILLAQAFGQSAQTYQIGYQTAHLLCAYDPDIVSGLYQMKLGTKFQVETAYGTYVYIITSIDNGAIDETTGYIIDKTGRRLFELESTSDIIFIYTDYPANAHSNEKLVIRAVLCL